VSERILLRLTCRDESLMDRGALIKKWKKQRGQARKADTED